MRLALACGALAVLLAPCVLSGRAAADPLAQSYASAAAAARAKAQLRAAAEAVLDDGDAGVLAARLRALKAGSPEAGGVIAQAETFLDDLAQKPGLAQDDSLAAAVSEELTQLAQEPDVAAMEARSARELRPRRYDEAFPEDIPLSEWNKLDPIRRFLVKHRWNRPKTYAPVVIEDLEAGRLNVQKGVEVVGVVVETDVSHTDFDYNFRIGDVVMEVTPEWRLLHRRMHMPQVGETVRVRGWTYYDGFHKVEDYLHKKLARAGGDGNKGESESERESLWEIHPVQDVELVRPAPPPAAATGPVEPMCEDFPPDECPPRAAR